MYGLITIILLTYLLIKIYLYWTLEILNGISYFLAIFPYYFNLRRNIVEKNLNHVFKNIEKNKIERIYFRCLKIYILNCFIVLNQYLFGDSFLVKYYNIDKDIKLNNKSFIALCHLGLYYDFMSFYKIFNKTFCGIYKGNIDWKIKNKNIVYLKHSNINLLELNKYYVNSSPIDQKPDNVTFLKLNFLNNNVPFHSYLVSNAIASKRDIYFYYCLYKSNKINVKFEKIDTINKSIDTVLQDLADIMTNIILQNPEQYLWLHNRFNFK